MEALIYSYYKLAKPGIVYGNSLAVAAGFLLASRADIDVGLLLATLLGIGLIMASGCVFNNYIDRDIDALMERTKRRALVTGEIPPFSALVYATILGTLGLLVLMWFTNLVTVLIAFFGLWTYVVLYSLISKRRSVHATLIGAIAGAIPPVVGYCAVSNTLDMGAIILFFILLIWQFPHAYAIAMYRYDDYAAASIPVLPIKEGAENGKLHMVLYIIAFMFSTQMLTYFNYTGLLYAGVMFTLSALWLGLAVRGFSSQDDAAWGKLMFHSSLFILVSWCLLIAIDTVRI